MGSVFSFIFKYRWFYFQQGDFTFQWGPGWVVTALCFALLALLVGGLYWRRWIQGGQSRGRGLAALRLAFFCLLLLMAFRPSLVLSTLVPRENMLALLVDNSRSMGIMENSQPRGEPLLRLLDPDAGFMSALEEKFFVRSFLFEGRGSSSKAPLPLDWTGDQTNVVAGIERVLADSRNLPLAGIVLFSDGSDNSFQSFQPLMAELNARKIPIYTVGVGPEQLDRDVEITQVSAGRVVLPDSVTGARVTLRHQGFGGSRGRLEVREGSSLVHTQEIYFPRDAPTVVAEVALSPKTEGIKEYQFTIQPLEGEEITANNSLRTIVQVRDLRPRILYVEGHPRWEYKFIRQALIKDQNLRLETLLRTALNKFYRQGIAEETTLASGFPSDREELFEYKGLVLGSVESSFFTFDQMAMIKDFVSKRGGGFLMLGGGSSFAAGAYQNTPIEEVLPAWLPPETNSSTYSQGQGLMSITAHGERHPALSLASEGRANTKSWQEMPPLTDWNSIREVKPGTTTLAQLEITTAGDRNTPLLAFHRFGRGHAVALLTGSSWRWQMGLESEDQSHETFWRQMMRWLVSLSKDPVSVETEREIYSRNEQVLVRAEVNDKAFNRINNAVAEATVTAPDGTVSTFPLRWSAREDGVYEGEWTAGADGLYRVSVEATTRSNRSPESFGQASTTFLTETGAREYFDPAQKRDFLERLSEQTGGRYYPLAEVSRLPEEIVYTERQSSNVEVLDLWDMPINFALLLGLLIGEWVLRKRYGAI